MKKFLKPFILEWKHVAQSKKVLQPSWNKTEEHLIGKPNSPLFQFSIEHSLQPNLLLQQLIIDFVTQQQKIHQNPTGNNPTNISLQPQQWQVVSWKPRHTAFGRQACKASLSTMPTLQKAREVIKLLSVFSPAILYIVHLLEHFSSLLKYKTSCFPSLSRYEE